MYFIRQADQSKICGNHAPLAAFVEKCNKTGTKILVNDLEEK